MFICASPPLGGGAGCVCTSRFLRAPRASTTIGNTGRRVETLNTPAGDNYSTTLELSLSLSHTHTHAHTCTHYEYRIFVFENNYNPLSQSKAKNQQQTNSREPWNKMVAK